MPFGKKNNDKNKNRNNPDKLPDSKNNQGEKFTLLLGDLDSKIRNNIDGIVALYQEGTITTKSLGIELRGLLLPYIKTLPEYKDILKVGNKSYYIQEYATIEGQLIQKYCSQKVDLNEYEGKTYLEKFVVYQRALKNSAVNTGRRQVKQSLTKNLVVPQTPSMNAGLEKLQAKGVRIKELQGVVLPPDQIERGMSSIASKPREQKSGVDKLTQCVKVLELIEKQKPGTIDRKSIEVSYGSVDRVSRKQSYVVIKIKSLNKTLYINNEYGEAIYVVDGILSDDAIQEFGKQKHRKELGATKIIFDYGNPKSSRQRVASLLTNNSASEKGEKKLSRISFDKEYINNPKYIRHYLEAYTKQLGINIGEITTNVNYMRIKVRISTGEEISLNGYLYRVLKILGSTGNLSGLNYLKQVVNEL